MRTVLSKGNLEVRAGRPSDVFGDPEVVTRCGLDDYPLYVAIIEKMLWSNMTRAMIWSPSEGWKQFAASNPHIRPLPQPAEKAIAELLGGREELAKEIAAALAGPLSASSASH